MGGKDNIDGLALQDDYLAWAMEVIKLIKL
jgi:hypothetical protein